MCAQTILRVLKIIPVLYWQLCCLFGVFDNLLVLKIIPVLFWWRFVLFGEFNNLRVLKIIPADKSVNSYIPITYRFYTVAWVLFLIPAINLVIAKNCIRKPR